MLKMYHWVNIHMTKPTKCSTDNYNWFYLEIICQVLLLGLSKKINTYIVILTKINPCIHSNQKCKLK